MFSSWIIIALIAIITVRAQHIPPVNVVTSFEQQGGKIVGSSLFDGTEDQGSSVAISSNGLIAAIGGYEAHGSVGAVWVYSRGGDGWLQIGTHLEPDDNIGAAQFGWAVALSSDGSVLAIGGNADNGTIGAAWIFRLNSATGTWTQDGRKLVGDHSNETNHQGNSVSLSADGTVLAVGSDASGKGGVWIFNYNGVSWSQEGSKITPLESQYSIGQHFGVEVSLSASGNVLAVQSTSCNFTLNPETMSTCTYIFYGISPGNWADASVVLNTTVTAVQSVSLTLSEDGSTVAVGIAADNSVCIYSISDDPSAWAPYCIGTGAGDIGFGTSVSLSSSGNVLAVGAVHDGTAGGTFVFVKDVEWSQSQFIGGTSSSGSSLQGSSVAISSDGSTLIVGGDGDDGGIGAEWIFSEISSVSASHQSKPAFFLLLLLLLSLCLY